jgi:hypothetical protein
MRHYRGIAFKENVNRSAAPEAVLVATDDVVEGVIGKPNDFGKQTASFKARDHAILAWVIAVIVEQDDACW